MATKRPWQHALSGPERYGLQPVHVFFNQVRPYNTKTLTTGDFVLYKGDVKVFVGLNPNGEAHLVDMDIWDDSEDELRAQLHASRARANRGSLKRARRNFSPGMKRTDISITSEMEPIQSPPSPWTAVFYEIPPAYWTDKSDENDWDFEIEVLATDLQSAYKSALAWFLETQPSNNYYVSTMYVYSHKDPSVNGFFDISSILRDGVARYNTRCSKCGKEGHNSRTCGQRRCGRCKQTGHTANTCTTIIHPSNRGCSFCGKPGHYKQTCNLLIGPQTKEEAGTKKRHCRACGKQGHNVQTCPRMKQGKRVLKQRRK